MVYLLVLISVVAMSAAQLLVKKGVLSAGQFPQSFGQLIPFFVKACANVYFLSAIFLAILTTLAWLLAITRAQLSFLYPFMALSFVLVALFSLLILKEDVSLLRWVGIIVICVGVFLVSKS